MRVLTWNLWWRFGGAWRERQPAIAATIGELEPDVLCLQEVWGTAESTQAHVLAGELGMHAAFAAPSLPPPPEAPDQDGVEVGVAIVGRWPIRSVEETLLPSGHRDATVALAAIIDHPDGPLHVVTSCLDWDPDFAEQRLVQTRALAELATQPARDGPLPVVLGGDLNAPPDAPEIRALTDSMVDAWSAAGGDGDGHTYEGERIDYILARPGRPENGLLVERAFVAGRRRGGVEPSDHYAVVADLR